MTLALKHPASKGKSKRGGGPVTEAGKQHVRMNAWKHGFFAKDSIVREEEKSEYEELRTALHEQFAPSTAMQQVGFEKIVWCAWRLKQSIRIESGRLNMYLEVSAQQSSSAEGTEEKTEVPRWYLAGRAELRAAERLLMDLRGDIQNNGWYHAEEWKEKLTKTFSSSWFYDLLTNWSPGNVEAIKASEALAAHARNFDMPLPEPLGGGTSDSAIGDPRSRWDMMVKLVELQQQHVKDLRLLLDERGSGGDSQGMASLEIGSRYFTTASRNLDRAVAWYQDIKRQGL